MSVFSYFLLFLTVLPLSLGKEDNTSNESFLWRLCSSTVQHGLIQFRLNVSGDP